MGFRHSGIRGRGSIRAYEPDILIALYRMKGALTGPAGRCYPASRLKTGFESLIFQAVLEIRYPKSRERTLLEALEAF